MEYYKIINQKLLELYGKDIAGRANYRIVQNSRSLTEKRKGEFTTWAGPLIVGTEYAIREVPKYNYVPEGYWILEKLFYTTNPELTDNFCYEPLWVFRDPKTGERQQPILKACEFLIRMALTGRVDLADRETLERKKEDEVFEMLGGNAGISEKLMMQEGVSFAGLDANAGLDAPVQNKG